MKKLLTKNQYQYALITDAEIFDSCIERIKSCSNKTTIIIPHVCNNLDIFSGGFAKAIGDRFPEVKENYHLLGKNFLKNNFGYSQFIRINTKLPLQSKIIACNMICQDGFLSGSKNRALHYGALVSSMYKVKKYINELRTQSKDDIHNIEIHAPKFGSGIAGGNWNFISELIEDIWTDLPIYIYQFNNKNS
jgi:hypothetical protein